jgi:RNA polymerase sigma-70 factor (ECF subfamily)
VPNDKPLTPDTGEISALLWAWSDGRQAALDDLIPLIYEELRRLAHGQMNGERPGHSLQTTALVNEAYLRLVDYNRMRWQDRAHFFAVSAQLMRRILVDHARRNNLKRGAGIQHVSLEETPILADHGLTNVVAIHDALAALEKFDSRKAKVVELRFFGGLTIEETAAVLKTSSVTVMRDWTSAKAWLYRELTKEVYDA